MYRARIVAPLVLMSLVVLQLGSPAYAADHSPLADNAALAYWQALSSLPKLTESQQSALNEALKHRKPITAELMKAVTSSSESLRQLHRGNKYRECVWGLDYDRGLEMTLLHLGQSRELAKLACLRARIRFEKGQTSEAIDDVAATMTLARHLGSNGIVISLLVQFAVESQAISVAAAYLPDLDAEELDYFARRFDAIPASKTTIDGWRMEKQLLLEWVISELSKPGGKDRILAMFPNKDEGTVFLRKLSPEELRAAAIGLRGIYDRFIAVMGASPDEVDKLAKQIAEELKNVGPTEQLGGILLPAAVSLRRSEAAHQTRLAMFKAAMSVVKQGQDALKRSELADPFGQGPFSYTKTKGGFRLASTLIGRDGQPVTLEIGEVVEN